MREDGTIFDTDFETATSRMLSEAAELLRSMRPADRYPYGPAPEGTTYAGDGQELRWVVCQIWRLAGATRMCVAALADAGLGGADLAADRGEDSTAAGRGLNRLPLQQVPHVAGIGHRVRELP